MRRWGRHDNGGLARFMNVKPSRWYSGREPTEFRHEMAQRTRHAADRTAPAALVLLAIFCGVFGPIARADEAESFFETSIRPVLVTSCFRCHGGERVCGGLRVDSRAALLQGGDSGPAIVPGNPQASLLVQAISRHPDVSAMPPESENALRPDQVTEFESWISADAVWPAEGPAFEVAGHWAFAPVVAVSPPPVNDAGWCRTTIDRFIRGRQEAAGSEPLPTADRRTLIRRATFDLTGLPPTPEEVEAFLSDPSPDAFATVVDRLLDSPAYGERWGRHWLDVVRYADTAGETADYPVPVAWRYRNYCIDAFNRDLPYDQFLREQIAGDILAAEAPGESTQRYAEQIIATGYLAISRRFGFDSENYHHLTIQDTIDTVGQSVMGLSLGCARCHDHKFDPISVRDYHALYGIFESSRYPFPGSEQKQRVRSLAPLVSPHANERRWRDFQTDVARLSQELASLDRSPPTATLRSVTDIDGDFELQAPAHGGSNGVLVAPWRYEGAIAVTAAAQSPFQHLHPGGRCGVSVAAGAGPYRCTQSLRPAPQGSGALRYINLDIRTASPTADAAGRHRFTIGDWHESAVEIVIAAESLSLHADGEVSELGSFPPGQWINLQLVIDTTGRSVSGRYGRPGSVREFGPFRLGSAWAGEIDHVELAAAVDPVVDAVIDAVIDPGATAYAAAPIDCDNIAVQSFPIGPVSTELPATAASNGEPSPKAIRDRLRELSGIDGDLELQTAGAAPASPWNAGPASVVRLEANAQSPFTNHYPAGHLGLSLPNRAEYDGFGLTFPPISPNADGRLHVAFDFRLGNRDRGGDGSWRYYLGHGAGTSAAVELFFNGNHFFARGGQTTEPVAPLDPQRWYQVQLVVEVGKRTYEGLLLTEHSSTPFSGTLSSTWDGTFDYTFIDSYGHIGGARPAIDVDNVIVSAEPLHSLDSAAILAASADRQAEIASLRSTLSALDARADAVTAELRQLLTDGPVEMAYGMAEGTPHDARIQMRGEPAEPGAEVPRGFVAALGNAELAISPAGSGRLELAQWLTRPDHPLTARVMVNRIWQHHFGRGLVATPNDFGVRGRPPTHPELLDWLAAEFVRSGWSVKSLHRQILSSATWQQATAVLKDDPSSPDTRSLYVGFQRRRLAAEEIRDAVLAVSGGLDRSRGEGHPFPPPFEWGFSQHGPFSGIYDHERRSVYLMTSRLKRHPFLALFDGADPNASTADRLGTTVPTQALTLLNSPFVRDTATKLATRVSSPNTPPEAALARAFHMALSRHPGEAEFAKFGAYLRQQLGENPSPETTSKARAQTCLALLCTNEFIYVD